MSGRGATFVLMYREELKVDTNFTPSYFGGRNRPLHVPRNCNLEQLKFMILRALKYDPSKYSVKLVCRVPVGNEYVASEVEDDEVCEVLLCQAATEFFIMYVDVKEIEVLGDNNNPPNLQRYETLCSSERDDVVAGPSRVEPVEELLDW
ncbi:hypothetical protein KFK09_011478 [Dendrobium nobile]|uniref:PB1 domain-containing protein n=1 Tax=Dendrobium nobile TaxID=94219 RepID=A0A8T3BIB2_DENNO|nr:hypothetical protein KFK09_011478 [Dendrobium nobile]